MQGGVRVARDDGGRDGRVETARQVRPDRDVAAQEPQAGCLDDPLPEGLGVLLGVLYGLAAPLGKRDAPVGSLPEPVPVEDGVVPRLELLDAAEHRAGRDRRPVGEGLVETGGVEGALHRGVGEDGLHLGREQQACRPPGEEQRAYPEPVAGEHQPLRAPVPQRDGPLAVEAGEALLAPLLPGVHDHLGVARRPEGVTAVPQFLAELDVVEDLPVERHPHGAVLVAERLGAARGVDDGEPGVPQRGAPVAVLPVAVRPAVPEPTHHAAQQGQVRRAVVADDPADAAHQTAPRRRATKAATADGVGEHGRVDLGV